MPVITAQVELKYPDGLKKVKMVLKEGRGIESCEVDKAVMLNLIDGSSHTGIFKGMADKHIKLQSLDGTDCVGI